jgi:hypothetical protein
LVFVQTRALEFAVSVAPAGMLPTAPPPLVDGFLPALGFVVTVLPPGVVVAAGGGGGLAFGVDFGAVLGVDFGALRTGALLSGTAADDAGTSFSCGCEVESRFAMARSRLSVESAPSPTLSGPFFDSELQAPSSAADTSRDGPTRRIYFNMRIPPGVN